MAKSKTQPPVDPYSPEVIELMVEYRRGWRNQTNAVRDMAAMTGLEPDICKVLLDMNKGMTVTQIRGYSKEPERLAEGKKRKAARRLPS